MPNGIGHSRNRRLDAQNAVTPQILWCQTAAPGRKLCALSNPKQRIFVMHRTLLAAVFAALVTATSVAAQGTQTGTITGTIHSGDGVTLPGVTVSATAPTLQGERNAVSDVNGVFVIRGLPAG